jgi:hypothetical protein
VGVSLERVWRFDNLLEVRLIILSANRRTFQLLEYHFVLFHLSNFTPSYFHTFALQHLNPITHQRFNAYPLIHFYAYSLIRIQVSILSSRHYTGFVFLYFVLLLLFRISRFRFLAFDSQLTTHNSRSYSSISFK